nr:unnamed protein product [Callosobruchus chinensis]
MGSDSSEDENIPVKSLDVIENSDSDTSEAPSIPYEAAAAMENIMDNLSDTDDASEAGLILGPPSLALQVRGSALHCELVTQSVKNLHGLSMTRKEASKLLGATSDTDSGSCSQDTPVARKNLGNSSRLAALEQESAATRSLLQEILNRLDNKKGGVVSSDLEEDQGVAG